MTTDDNDKHAEITMNLSKSGVTYTISLSVEDKVETLRNWCVLIGRKGHVYAHRTSKGKKVYLARSIMERVLDRPLEKGETVYHKDGNSRNKTRDNLGLKISKKLAKERESLKGV